MMRSPSKRAEKLYEAIQQKNVRRSSDIIECKTAKTSLDVNDVIYCDQQGWISDMGIDGPTFVPKSGYFLLIWVKVCPHKLAFS